MAVCGCVRAEWIGLIIKLRYVGGRTIYLFFSLFMLIIGVNNFFLCADGKKVIVYYVYLCHLRVHYLLFYLLEILI